ncbi:MAG: response regulator [Parafilimonas sp.]|nr:response regulator [Parafilimonas sp.]
MTTHSFTPIMYIDDDADDQEIFKQTVSNLNVNHPVISFWNGREALKYLRSEKINPFIIFCDVNMPIMDGFELRKQISEDKKLLLDCIPFIFYSTNADKKYVDMAYTLTVQGYFKKPSDSNVIKQQLQRIIYYWLDCKHPNNC